MQMVKNIRQQNNKANKWKVCVIRFSAEQVILYHVNFEFLLNPIKKFYSLRLNWLGYFLEKHLAVLIQLIMI